MTTKIIHRTASSINAPDTTPITILTCDLSTLDLGSGSVGCEVKIVGISGGYSSYIHFSDLIVSGAKVSTSTSNLDGKTLKGIGPYDLGTPALTVADGVISITVTPNGAGDWFAFLELVGFDP